MLLSSPSALSVFDYEPQPCDDMNFQETYFYQRLLGFHSLKPVRTGLEKIHLAAEPLSPLIIILC